MTYDEKLVMKLALLADWQYFCRDEDEEPEMNEDQYWAFMQRISAERLREFVEHDFGTERSAPEVLKRHASYLSDKYKALIPVDL